MKKFLIILVVVFLVACSKSDKSGHTGSIDEPTGSSVSSSSVDSKSSSSNKKGDYVWPEEIEGTFKLPHNPYSGKIMDFDWSGVVPGFSEPDKYSYGFDRNPEAIESPEKDEVVYISVEIGKKASFIPHFKDAKEGGYSQYKLVNKDDPSDEIPLTDGVQTEITNAELANDGAHLTYSLYGFNKEWKNLDKRIEVLAYKRIPKNFIYVQLDGDGWNADADENSFTKSRVDKYFNDVFGQAVTYSNSLEEPASKYGLDKLIKVDMIKPKEDVYNEMMQAALAVMNDNINDIYINGKYNTESAYLHIVYAINKERKMWSLENSINDDFELVLGSSFKPRHEPANVTYNMISRDGCESGVGSSPIEVEIKEAHSIDNKGNDVIRYYAYRNGKKMEFSPCDVLYTDDGYPVVPDEDGVFGGTAASSTKITLKFDDYLPYGSIVVAPRGAGESAKYTLMHELGHSFGYTDVEKRFDYVVDEFVDAIDADFTYPFTSSYASVETNLMTWQQPSGRKIRYRNTPIVCTGGTVYYGGYSESKGFYSRFGAVERPVEGKGENQWECIRGACFTTEYSTEARKTFWNTKSGWCGENEIVSDRETFSADRQESMKKQYINYRSGI